MQGEVVSATFAQDSRGQPTFLNLDKPYPAHVFTVVIWGDDRGAFPGPPETIYLDREICVTGVVELYRGLPQIVISSPGAVEVL